MPRQSPAATSVASSPTTSGIAPVVVATTGVDGRFTVRGAVSHYSIGARAVGHGASPAQQLVARDGRAEVRLELATGTNDALTNAVLERRIDAAFVAEAPSMSSLAHQPVFAERLAIISNLDHRPIRRPRDVVVVRRIGGYVSDARAVGRRDVDLALARR